MCRISPVSEDWADKGCHLHVGKVEVALRPDHVGGIVCRRVFSKTEDWEIEAASKLVDAALADTVWRRKLRATVERAMIFL
jgi:hypothetical protein